MPLNKKGKKIMKSMEEQYGKKKAKQIFYASKNKGKIKGVEKLRYGGGADMGAPGRAQERAERGYGGTGKGTGGRDPRAATKGKVSDAARQRLEDQRKEARGRISPSTTPVGMALAQGIGALTGVPFIGGKIGSRMVDYSPMAFGVPKSTRPKQTMMVADNQRDSGAPIQQPISGPIAINQPIIPLAQRRLATVSPTGRFNYSLKKGGMLRQGKPKLAKKGWK
jgi:hypothetical protein